MKYKSTLILFLIAVSIGGLYFLYIKPHMEEKKLIEDFEKRFFRADTADIEFLRIDAGQGPITIHKSGKSWKITKPAEYVPDLGAIESLFKALAKGRLIKLVGDAEELDAFGFNTVHIILSLGYSDTIDVLKIAGESPSAAGHYAFSERLGKIFLVDKEFVTAMNLKPLDLREKRLFSFQPKELGRIKIQRKSDTVKLEKRSEGWHMISPLRMKADNDDMKNLIDTFHTQKAEAFLKWRPDLANLERKMILELDTTSGMPIGSYELYFWGTEWDKGIIVHSPGAKEASRVRRDFWVLLDGNYSNFAYRNLISMDQNEAKKISIVSGEYNFVFEKQSGRWHYESSPVPDEAMIELIDFLKAWKAEKLIIENRDLGKDQFILEVKYADSTERIAVSDFNMDYEISSARMFAARKGTVKKEKVDYLYTHSSNLESAAIVSSVDIKNIMIMVRGISNE
jgi:hypothetical protein